MIGAGEMAEGLTEDDMQAGYALGDELFQSFLFSRTPPSTKPLAPAYYAQVDTQLAAVEAAQESCEPYDAQAVQRHSRAYQCSQYCQVTRAISSGSE